MRPSHDDYEPVAIAPPAASRRCERIGVVRVGSAVGRLIADRRRLKHVPTIGQIKAMAWLDGREPCSYLLDPRQNFVPEPLDFGYERELGRHALNFTLRDDDGCFVTEIGGDGRRRNVRPAGQRLVGAQAR